MIRPARTNEPAAAARRRILTLLRAGRRLADEIVELLLGPIPYAGNLRPVPARVRAESRRMGRS